MKNFSVSDSAFGAQAVNGLQAEAIFRARMWEGLRHETVEAMGRERWREVMMAALNHGEDVEEDPSRIPVQRLIDEVVFSLGTNRVTLLERMGRRMMDDMLTQVDPLLKQLGDPLKILSMVLDSAVLGQLGVVDIRPEEPAGEASSSCIRMTTLAMFKSSAAFHLAALKELGDQLGVRFHVELLGSGELTGEGNAYRVSWSVLRG